MCTNESTTTLAAERGLWDLDKSERIACELLAEQAGCSLDEFDRAMAKYRRRKAQLIDALDPATGRRTVRIDVAPTEAQRVRGWTDALGGRACELATAAYDVALRDHDRFGNDRSQKTLDKRRDALAAIRSVQATLESFAAQTPYSAIALDKVRADDYRLDCIRDGMTVSRALAKYLRHHGADANSASMIVDAVVTAAAVKPTQGTVVLSANVLDILTVSESCSYSSCHSFEGCHRAGPQQYLYDPHTLVAYYYTEERCFDSHKLPYKTFRQMVYVDSASGTAALQRHYPEQYAEGSDHPVLLTIRREVARLLMRLRGQDDSEPRWKIGTEKGDAMILVGADLAYLDRTVGYLALDDGARPTIQLATRVPCLACGKELTDPGLLTCCEECRRCDRCQCRLVEDDYYSSPSGEDTYCGRCYERLYTYCDGCHRDRDADDVERMPDDSAYCTRCADEHFPRCEGCENRFPIGDLIGGYCQDCSPPRCFKCTEEYDPSQCEKPLPFDCNEDTCDPCRIKQELRVRLTYRLRCSPRYIRLAITDTLYGTDDALAYAMTLWHPRLNGLAKTSFQYACKLLALPLSQLEPIAIAVSEISNPE